MNRLRDFSITTSPGTRDFMANPTIVAASCRLETCLFALSQYQF